MSRKLLIALEAIDGVGKTTVAQILAQLMGAEYVKTPTADIYNQRHYYDQCGDPLVRFMFYLNSNLITSRYIAPILEEKPVVCDRYLVSTIVFHQAMGVDTSIVDVDRLPILKPDFYFCLQAEEKVRLERLHSRGVLSDTDGQIDLLRRADKLLPQYCTQVIDTTYITAEEVANIIYSTVS